MIQEVDAALEALVRRDALNGSRVEVVFDAPTKDWVARRNAPAINIYLYDIREDLSRREMSRVPFRESGAEIVSEHRLPPRRFRLSYLITAWTQRPEDEHRLLAACLATLVRNEIIPLELTSGSLAASPYPVILSVALPLPAERSIADVWSALGGELKPSLDLTAIAPLDPAWSEPAAKPVLEGPVLGAGGPGIATERAAGRGRRGGRTQRSLLPAEPAVQAELVRAGEVGVRTAAAETGAGKPAAGKAKRPIDAEPTAEPDFASLGGGRIVRLRGINRP
jgi:hypothetical protein